MNTELVNELKERLNKREKAINDYNASIELLLKDNYLTMNEIHSIEGYSKFCDKINLAIEAITKTKPISAEAIFYQKDRSLKLILTESKERLDDEIISEMSGQELYIDFNTPILMGNDWPVIIYRSFDGLVRDIKSEVRHNNIYEAFSLINTNKGIMKVIIGNRRDVFERLIHDKLTDAQWKGLTSRALMDYSIVNQEHYLTLL